MKKVGFANQLFGLWSWFAVFSIFLALGVGLSLCSVFLLTKDGLALFKIGLTTHFDLQGFVAVL